MSKPVFSILDPERRPKKKKKRRKRKVDYAELLKAPVIPAVQCRHTKRAQDASNCSQCLNLVPSVVHKPPTADWWSDDTVDDLKIDIDVELISDDE